MCGQVALLTIFLDDVTPFTTSQGHLIEDIRADKNTLPGMQVEGRGNTERRNQVVDTGSSTVSSNVFGMAISGSGARLINNDINSAAVTGTGNTFGISLQNAAGAIIEGNRIDVVSSAGGSTTGIYVISSHNALIINTPAYLLGFISFKFIDIGQCTGLWPGVSCCD